ncbi:MAG: DUF4149 domain-containing protein, partial [Polyangiaceae bacterium]
MNVFERALAAVGLLAVAVWMGGLIALGAIGAPVIFGVVPFPTNADAMTIVFRRFDLVAMGCATILMATEAVRRVTRPSIDFTSAAPRTGRSRMVALGIDRARTLVSLVAAGTAVFEGLRLSPRIAQLHASGAIMGVGAVGTELASLHALAELCGKGEVLLLATYFALF